LTADSSGQRGRADHQADLLDRGRRSEFQDPDGYDIAAWKQE
jgi:hypothetical protein